MVSLFIAYRHIRERKFQSIVSIIGVSLALIVFFTSLSISNGLKRNTINSILSLNPHISVMIDTQKEGKYKEIIDKIQKIDKENIKDVVKRVSIQGFVKAKNNVVVPLITGIEDEKINLNIIKTSKHLSKNEPYAIVGEKFAQNNDVDVDNYINVVTVDGKEIRLKISKIFKTGFLPYDQNFVIIPVNIGQILLEKGDVIETLEVKVKDPSDIKSIKKIINKINMIDEKVFSYSWADENKNLLSAIEFEEFILVVILSMLFIIASFGVSVILNMSVREKTTDIGILKACGYKDKTILKIFVLEGVILGVTGMIISAILTPIVLKILSLLSNSYLTKTYYISKLPISISVKEVVLIYTVSLIVILLASILPARKAAKMDPTNAIRFNS
ncbi:ABC transporter permease [Caviibacter abscessus]|uniref:ABC transporter permease n=1 Tax=Caviibacter abscessus TaxID=1766719 RepID=UPI00082E5003|nr:FtsX-like permease family protein [Caviibacter abscessus]